MTGLLFSLSFVSLVSSVLIVRASGQDQAFRSRVDLVNSQRDYGNRSGVWRVFEALERYGVRASVSLNAAMCDHMPEIIAECLRLKWELFSHGIYNTRLISGMSEDEVRAVIKDGRVLDQLIYAALRP